MTNTPDITEEKKPVRRRTPQDRKPKEATPSEEVDAKLEQQELIAELLADLPSLRPAERFRLAHRNAFHNLRLDAIASGAFSGPMEYDLENPDDIARFKKVQTFVESIDEWAETIAEDAYEYARWAEGKTAEHFIALFERYASALGESSGSES